MLFWRFIFVFFLPLLLCAKKIEKDKEFDVKNRENKIETGKKFESEENKENKKDFLKKKEGKDLKDEGTSIYIFELRKESGEIDIKSYEELFARAINLYTNGNLEDAKNIFQVLEENPPTLRHKSLSKFNLAISLERMGFEDDALHHYEELLTYPFYDIREDALLRYWRIKISRGENVDFSFDFSDDEKKEFAKSLYFLAETERMIRNGEYLPYFEEEMKKFEPKKNEEAKYSFKIALGNLYLLKSLSLKIKTTDIKELERVIEEKAQYLLQSQRYYFSAIQGLDPWWVTVSIFKLGETYKILFEELLNSPLPPNLTDEEKEVYKEELMKEISPALNFAEQIYKKNVEISKKIKLTNIWIKRSEEGIEKIKVWMKKIEEIKSSEIKSKI